MNLLGSMQTANLGLLLNWLVWELSFATCISSPDISKGSSLFTKDHIKHNIHSELLATSKDELRTEIDVSSALPHWIAGAALAGFGALFLLRQTDINRQYEASAKKDAQILRRINEKCNEIKQKEKQAAISQVAAAIPAQTNTHPPVQATPANVQASGTKSPSSASETHKESTNEENQQKRRKLPRRDDPYTVEGAIESVTESTKSLAWSWLTMYSYEHAKFAISMVFVGIYNIVESIYW